MKRIYHLTITLLLFLVLTGLLSCEKKDGTIYLRVVQSFKVDSEIVVKDSQKEIPADGNYHEATGYLETEYKLLNVDFDSLYYKTPELSGIADTVFKKSVTVNGYFGDFERLPYDSYYTLTLKYNIEYYDPIYVGNNWYFIIYNYSDNSTLSYSPTP